MQGSSDTNAERMEDIVFDVRYTALAESVPSKNDNLHAGTAHAQSARQRNAELGEDNFSGICEHESQTNTVDKYITNNQPRGIGLLFRQIRALMYKNFLLKRRNYCQSFCELFTPILMMLLLFFGYKFALENTTVNPATEYVNQIFNTQPVLQTAVNLFLRDFFNYSHLNDTLTSPLFGPQMSASDASSNSFISSGTEISSSSSITSLAEQILDYSGPMPIPTFDEFVGLQRLLRAFELQFFSNSSAFQNELRILSLLVIHTYVLLHPGKIIFAPDTPAVRELFDSLSREYVYFNSTQDGIFSSEQAAVDWALRDYTKDPSFDPEHPYDQRTWAVVSFKELDIPNGVIDYSIRCNYSVLPTTTVIKDRFNLGLNTNYQLYLWSGFMSIQMMIEDYVLQQTARLYNLSSLPEYVVKPSLLDVLEADLSNSSLQNNNLQLLEQAILNFNLSSLNVSEFNLSDVNFLSSFSAKNLTNLNITKLLSNLNLTLPFNLTQLSSRSSTFSSDHLKSSRRSSFRNAMNVSFLEDYYTHNLSDGVSGSSQIADSNWTVFDGWRSSSQLVEVPMPTSFSDTNPFYSEAGPFVGLVFAMAWLYPVSRLLKLLVEEKANRIKETMLCMGLEKSAYVASTFFTVFLQFVVITLICVFILVISIFRYSSFSVIFVFYFLYVLSLIPLSYCISIFFNRPKLAGIVGPIFVFAFVMPRFASFTSALNSNIGAKISTYVFSSTACAFGTDIIMQYEASNEGMHWSTIWQEPLNLGTVMVALALDTLLYAILAWYFELVVPNEYGQQRSPFFCCSLAWHRWSARSHAQSTPNVDDYAVDQSFVEKVPDELKKDVGVSVLGLVKHFRTGLFRKRRTVHAINGLTFNLYRNHISCLLGHNGAGKSTAISLITGLIPATSGTVFVNGLDIAKDLTAIRRSMGVCPQHDVIWPKLTAREHLELIAIIKGTPNSLVNIHVEQMLHEVDLWDARDREAGTYSGGMKRRLCVGMALIGGSQFILLDEPSSGVDPNSRIFIADLLRRFKAHRTILLTTHFMDEADLLADRILIMSNGYIRCIGTSLFLKSRFNIGYNLTITSLATQRQLWNPEQIMRLIAVHVPDAMELSRGGGGMSIRLPTASVDKFSALFDDIDSQERAFGIASYGLSLTSLEQVFVRIAREGQIERQRLLTQPDFYESSNLRITNSPLELSKTMPLCDNDDHSTIHVEKQLDQSGSVDSSQLQIEKTGNFSTATVHPALSTNFMQFPVQQEQQLSERMVASWVVQIEELLRKRWVVAVRDLKGRFFEIVLPVVVVALVLLILLINVNPAGPPIVLDASLYQTSYTPGSLGKSTVLYSGAELDGPVTSYLLHSANAAPPLSLLDFGVPAGREYPFLSTNILNATSSIEMSNVLLDTALNNSGNRPAAYVFDDLVAFSKAATILLPISPSRSAELLALLSAENNQFVRPSPLSEILLRVLSNASITPAGLAVYLPPAVLNSPVTLLHNSSYYHALPAYMAVLTRAKLQTMHSFMATASPSQPVLSSVGPPTVYYSLTNHPLPLTVQSALTIEALLSVFAALFVLLPFCFLAATFVIPVVKERSSKAKHLQLVSGVSPWTYWLSNYIWDMVDYTFIVGLVMIVFSAYNNRSFTGSAETAAATFLLFWLYGLAIIPMSYALSFGFSNHTAAQIAIAGIHFIAGFCLLIASYVMASISSTTAANAAAIPFYRALPQYCLGEGLINLATRVLYNQIDSTHESAFNYEVIGIQFTYLSVEAAAYFALTMIIELQLLSRARYFLFKVIPHRDAFRAEYNTIGIDDDVLAEARRIDEEKGNNSAILYINHLRKQFPDRLFPCLGDTKVAVHDLCLSVARGELFGQLGLNGSGKTTTFSMLTGEIKPTSGYARIDGYDVETQQELIRQRIGFCPQHDPLIDLMDVEHTLVFYGRLRGLSRQAAFSRARYLIKQLDLEIHAQTLCSELSGGSKRKLSLGIAVVGSPSLVLLDEPTTGVDIEAQHSIWNIIQDLNKQMAIVLTTHSMEEVEALCSRVGIMARGRLCALGTIQHLKSKFGQGYSLELHFPPQRASDVELFLERSFAGMIILDRYINMFKISLPKTMPLSLIFSILENNRHDLGLSNYGISQTTLEQVFISVARTAEKY